MNFPTFKKGVHPSDFKDLTNRKVIEKLPLPEEVFIPVQQHIGAPAEPVVKRGEEVRTGQIIARSDRYVSGTIHASITGKVKAVGGFLHPLGSKALMIHIIRTGDDEWKLLDVPGDWERASAEQLRTIVRDAGIVGLGGAAFPTHVKLQPPTEKSIDSFILNGAECEPYLTADHRIMVEQTEKILTGMGIIMKILGVENGYIGIEDNKPGAIQAMQKTVKEKRLGYKVIPLVTKYPQGAEKMLIHSTLGRKVPTGGLPMDVGVVVNNVGTALAVAEAVTEGKPLIQRVLTVTGDGITEPRNVLARIGTPFANLIEYAGGLKEDTVQVFMGGPMMGNAQYDLSVPIVKASGGIICSSEKRIQRFESYPCIQCGSCVQACPMNLVPTRLAKLAETQHLDELEEWGVRNCIECGSCAFVCPSHIPLVQWIRVGKFRLDEQESKQAA